MSKDSNAKPKTIDTFQVPRPLWRRVRKLIPRVDQTGKAGRKRADNHAVRDGIGYGLWTGCQWKAVHRDWFGVGSTTLHDRCQEWQASGVVAALMQEMVKFYHRQRPIKWQWQSLDAKACPAPLGGEATGKSPVDRGKQGSKIHLWVDQRGAPLAVLVTGANVHDKWSADDLMISSVVPRPETQQHLCADRGYDFPDVHQFVEQERDVAHIQHKRTRGEPRVEDCLSPGETRFPARRWVVERTFGWLAKRRSLRLRWCKKVNH